MQLFLSIVVIFLLACVAKAEFEWGAMFDMEPGNYSFIIPQINGAYFGNDTVSEVSLFFTSDLHHDEEEEAEGDHVDDHDDHDHDHEEEEEGHDEHAHEELEAPEEPDTYVTLDGPIFIIKPEVGYTVTLQESWATVLTLAVPVEGEFAIFMTHELEELDGLHFIKDSHGDDVEPEAIFHHDEEHDDHDDDHDDKDVALWEVWLYASLSNLLCSLVSVLGILFVLSKQDATQYLTDLQSLGIGTLLGSAFLSLIPEVDTLLGLSELGPNIVILSGVACGFLLEVTLHSIHLHKADVVQEKNDPSTLDIVEHQKPPKFAEVMVEEPTAIGNIQVHHEADPAKPASVELTDGAVAVKSAVEVPDDNKHDQGYHSHGNDKALGGLVDHVTMTLLIGDGLHNFVDGALIGAAYFNGVSTGLMATLAISLHELPQELGEFAILLKAGWPAYKALGVNFCISFTAFIGMAVSIALGTALEELTPYFLAFSAGIFIYLALADLLPDVMQAKYRDKFFRHIFWITFGVLIIGLLTLVPGHDHEHGAVCGEDGEVLDDHAGHDH